MRASRAQNPAYIFSVMVIERNSPKGQEESPTSTTAESGSVRAPNPLEAVARVIGAAGSTEIATGTERGEISAATIARMMGLATVTETKLVEGKIDLLTAKLNTVQVKLEKVIALLGNVATGADLERIDVQVGALRTLVREVMGGAQAGKQQPQQAPVEEGKKPTVRIQSNS